MSIDLVKLRAQLTQEEGLRLRLYKDSVGKWTIGIGHNIEDDGISQAVAQFIFSEDVTTATDALTAHLPWWLTLDEVRQRVLIDMVFNMSIAKVLKFRRTLAAIQAGDYPAAAEYMSESLWATEVGARAVRLEAMMRTGEDQV
jgi:lysozyme